MAQYLKGSEEFVNKVLEEEKKKIFVYGFNIKKHSFITQQSFSNSHFFDGFFNNPIELKEYKSVIGVWRIKLK